MPARPRAPGGPRRRGRRRRPGRPPGRPPGPPRSPGRRTAGPRRVTGAWWVLRRERACGAGRTTRRSSSLGGMLGPGPGASAVDAGRRGQGGSSTC
ncbi:hypothetical protein [Ornithinimicrobium kibberense]|uniref:hypothetical protein n=1 Tax=Ornithinimicrobium kibberense TaxID=282060 RepID=UPI003609B239